MKKDPFKFQANQYDKIFKENIEAVLPGLIENILGIKAISSEELPDGIQHTKEREPDVLKRITDVQGKTFILHIEFQVADEPEMVYRMAEYYIMLERKYRLSVEQFVIFLGSAEPKMKTRIEGKLMRYEFPVINFSMLDYQLFLNSAKPEEIILSILANFKDESPQTALIHIIQRVEETSDSEFTLRRYFNQLRVLAQLRNLELNFKEAMESIAKYIDIKKDLGYMFGLEKGLEKGKESFVKYLLMENTHTTTQIARIADVSVDFVKEVQEKLSSESE